MALKNIKGNKKNPNAGKPSAQNRQTSTAGKDVDKIDMSPDPNKGYAKPTSPDRPGTALPRNIQDTKAWRQSQAGLQNLWTNYKQALKNSWEQMPREDQEGFITRLSQIVTVGVSVLAVMFVYGFLPKLIAIFAVPAVLLGSYWAGTKVVAPIILLQFESLLNEEF